MSQNQNQGNVQGDDRNKEKSSMTWHVTPSLNYLIILIGLKYIYMIM
ncbi:hypothetical protein MtrunA17_Chr8g0364561 [Medicago truncatula]|uniref:Transmembrane protein n=1 Tax=Medicago truncatula TaxID=3880 RepID=A0A396GL88_MEDTR|nr:hypothetical protein MtrunA17_Chr8g0364561 [Medicago truncatula]